VGLRLIVEGFSITGAEGCGTVGTPEYCGNYKTCLLQLEQRIQQDFIASNDAIDKQCEDDPSPSTQANVSQGKKNLQTG
jgi:hypothetical protein